MTGIQSHRDLIVWNKAMKLVVEVYSVSSLFPASERWRLIDQITRSAVSVPANIAEGQGRTQQVAVAHVDPAKVEFARELAHRYPPDPNAATGVPNVIRTGKSEFYPEIPKELLERSAVDAEHLRIIRELDLRSALVVPFHGRTEVFGAMSFIYAQSDRRYTADDLAFADDEGAALLRLASVNEIVLSQSIAGQRGHNRGARGFSSLGSNWRKRSATHHEAEKEHSFHEI